jgi:hypothetical protein
LAGSFVVATLLRARVLRHCLRAFADGVLRQLARKEQSDGRLDFAARDGRAAVVVGQTRCLRSDTLEDVVDKAVHDRHRLAADTGVRVDLFQHLVDVDSIALPSPAFLFLVTRANGLSFASGLLRSLARWLRRHVGCTD